MLDESSAFPSWCCAGQCLTPSFIPQGNKIHIYDICWFSWCKLSSRVDFKLTSSVTDCAIWKREANAHLLQYFYHADMTEFTYTTIRWWGMFTIFQLYYLIINHNFIFNNVFVHSLNCQITENLKVNFSHMILISVIYKASGTPPHRMRRHSHVGSYFN